MVLREITISFLLFTSYNSDNVKNIQMDEYALKVLSSAILIFRLLLHMRGTYVANIRLDFHSK